MSNGLLAPEREPDADQGTGTTKVQLGEAMSFISVTCRSGDDSKAAASSKATSYLGDVS